MVYQTLQSNLDLCRQFTRMIGVHAHPEWVKFLKHLTQFGRDPLWQEYRDPSPDPDELDMFDRTQTPQNSPQLIVGKKQGVSARKQNVSDLRVSFQIPVSFLEIGVQFLFADAADDATACAVAAIRGAAVSH